MEAPPKQCTLCRDSLIRRRYDGRLLGVDRVVGYYGDECSEINACLTARQPLCLQGDCISSGNTTFTCQCRPGWHGNDCSQYNPCSTDPCLNQGTCVNPESSVYHCNCVAGYYGVRCELYNPCSALQSALCQNGGTCRNTTDGNFTCSCVSG